VDTMDTDVTARRPTVVAFDVVETLFSLAPVREALAPLGVGLELFFGRLLRDGFALAAAGGFHPFRDVAGSALVGVAPQASEAQRDAVMAAFGRLPAHPDAEAAMGRLSEQGVRLVTLTNGGAETTGKLLESAGLAGYVERVLSVDEAGRWKPAPQPYRYAADALGLRPSEVALVAVHSWDVHGARRAGLVTGWCSRLEGTYPEVFEPPHVSGPDLVTVAEALLALPA
jgi:2-haloacid dehalogenase